MVVSENRLSDDGADGDSTDETDNTDKTGRTDSVQCPTVRIDTHGQIARSVMQLLDTLSGGKVRLEVTDDALSGVWRDPANVGMGDIHLDLDAALDSIESVESENMDDGGFVAGIQSGVLADRLSFARKTVGGPLGDAVQLRFADTDEDVQMLRGRTGITIRRDDGVVPFERESVVRNQDPDSIHETNRLFDSFDPPVWKASIEPDVFNTIAQALDGTKASTAQLRPDDVRSGDDDNPENVGNDTTATVVFDGGRHDDAEIAADEFRLEGAAEFVGDEVVDSNEMAEGAASELSLDYLSDVAAALKGAKMDSLSIEWRTQYPVVIAYSRAEWGLSGHFAIAPRIQSDGDRP